MGTPTAECPVTSRFQLPLPVWTFSVTLTVGQFGVALLLCFSALASEVTILLTRVTATAAVIGLLDESVLCWWHDVEELELLLLLGDPVRPHWAVDTRTALSLTL